MDTFQRQQDERRFSSEKKNYERLGTMIKQVTSRIAKMETSGVTVPSDLRSNLSEAQNDLKTILQAKTFDGAQEAINDIQDKMGNLQEGMQTLQALTQFSQMTKQFDRTVKQLDASYESVKKLAARSKVDVGTIVDQFRQSVDDIKTSLQQAKSTASGGDPDTALQSLQDLQSKIQDAFQYQGMVQMIQHVGSNIKQVQSLLTRANRVLVRQKKAGNDTTDLSSSIDAVTADLDQVKGLSSGPNADLTQLPDAVSSLYSDMQGLQGLMGGNNGSFQVNVPQQQNPSEFQAFQNFALPQFGNQGPMSGGQQNGPGPNPGFRGGNQAPQGQNFGGQQSNDNAGG